MVNLKETSSYFSLMFTNKISPAKLKFSDGGLLSGLLL